MVYDGGEQLIFINGRLVHRAEAPRPGPFARNRQLILGAQEKWQDSQQGPTALNGTGIMGAFRISSIARYQAAFTPKRTFRPDKDTELLFRFSTPNDTRLLDASKNRQHGTIHGAEWVTLEDK